MSEHDLSAVLDRIRKRDGAVWSSDAAEQREAEKFLGWLDLPDRMAEHLEEITLFADDCRSRFDHVVLLGMGGSSLCAEVLRSVFGSREGWPDLIVLDSVIPEAIHRAGERIDLGKTLFILSSKSGTTIEPLSLYRYFRGQLEEQGLDAGDHFIAITDPGSELESEAGSARFRKTFLNFADVGGRFSALSFFGLVPAALIGIDIVKLLERAEKEMADALTPSSAGARLGQALGEAWASGRDKLILRLPDGFESLGIWIEQLIAESTGKKGRGILPVHGEPLPKNDSFLSEDRFTVRYGEDSPSEPAHVLEPPANEYDLARELVIWEIATAVAGARLRINPFDQPDVQAAKELTRRILDSGDSQAPVDDTPSDADAVTTAIRNAAYVAVLAWEAETRDRDSVIDAFRASIVSSRGIVSTAGFGPRYLHSTGQYHKGAGEGGVHIFVVPPSYEDDIPIPGTGMTFGELARAQALGDIGALEARDRTVFLLEDLDTLQEIARHLD